VSYRHFSAQVTRVTPLTPHMTRITLGGLEDFPGAGLDHRVKVFFPLPGEDRPVYPTGDDWWERWQREPVRAVFRTYTIRRHRPELGEVDIDFVLHGDEGPGSRWASNARPGDHVGLWGPRAEYAPPPGTDWVLLAGDETALPAIGAILESLPRDATARVFVEVASPEERQHLDAPKGAEVRWVHRSDGESLLAAVREAGLPPGRPYAWVAAESSAVKQIRRHLVDDRGIDREAIYFSGYWKRGAAQE